jgi:MFS family permease
LSRLTNFKREYRELATGSVRELWVVYFSKLMESLAYFTTIMVMVLYFSSDLDMSDTEAGSLFGLWSLGYGLLTLFAGALCDVIGIKRSLLIGLCLCMIGRALFAFIPSYWIVAAGALPLLAMGMPLLIPIKSAAIKQFTTERSRGLAFAIFYALMNVGALFAGLVLDQLTGIVRVFGGEPEGELVMKKGHDVTRYVLDVWGLKISSYQLVFFFAFLVTALGFIAILFFMRKHSYAEEDIEAINRTAGRRNPFVNMARTMAQSRFWRFMLLIVLMSVVKLLFTHVHITVPKFMLREIGPDAAIGKTYAINGAMMMAIPPLMAVYVARFATYRVLIAGALISSFSPIFLAIPYHHYAPIAGLFGIHEVYIPIIMFYIVLSIGEALWGPKLYEYTANIAPKGEESTYMAMSSLPWIFAKLPAGMMSGRLLAGYCPEEGPRDSTTMWTIIAATTVAAPFLLIALRRVINQAAREPVAGAEAT